MAYTRPYDVTVPVGASTAAADIDLLFRQLKVDLEERLEGLLGVTITDDPLVPLWIGSSAGKPLQINGKQYFTPEYDGGNVSAGPLVINIANGNKQKFVMTGDVSVSFTGTPIDGTEFVIRFKQDSTGTRTISWGDPNIKWGQAGEPLPLETADTFLMVRFYYYGPYFYAEYIGAVYPNI